MQRVQVQVKAHVKVWAGVCSELCYPQGIAHTGPQQAGVEEGRQGGFCAVPTGWQRAEQVVSWALVPARAHCWPQSIVSCVLAWDAQPWAAPRALCYFTNSYGPIAVPVSRS